MRVLTAVFLTFIFAFHTGPLNAQNVEDHASVRPADNWVIVQEIPESFDELESYNGVKYLLADYQAKEEVNARARYERYANQLLSGSAVEENSTISIRFDPSFQNVILHSVQVIRDGVATDRLNLSEFQIYRFETDRDRLIYNGDLELAFIVPDVRVGDILDHSYTVVGRNPAFGPHFTDGLRHAYGVEVGRVTNRLLIQNDLTYQMKHHQDAADPEITAENGFSVLEWSQDDVAFRGTEDNRPYWDWAYPTTEVTSFASWAEVGQHLADAYDPAQFRSEDITAIAAEIASEHADPKDQLRAALDYVQSNIRYLGIELGAGGYIPRAPDLVLSRRFGDCKDVTLLLVTILEALDIKAAPVLVNTDDGYGLTAALPSIGAFDHVITTAWLDGAQHYLDATLDTQMGDIAHMEQGDHGFGLIVSPDSEGLFRAVGNGPEYSRDFTDTFDLRAEGSEVLFTSISTYRGDEAESMNAWVDAKGKPYVEENFLSYFQDYFPTIEQYGPFLIILDEDKAELNVTGFYRIPNAWSENEDQNQMEFTAYASELTSDLPEIETEEGTRKSPYSIPHSVRTRHTIDVKYPDDWELLTLDEEISLPSLDYTETRSVEGAIYRNVFTLESKSNRISPEDFEDTLEAHETIRNDAEVTFWYSLGQQNSN